ncbi:MAG: DNA modification methylase, partial [Pseudomonadota bacterium]
DMSETQKRAYMIADNKIAEQSDWDRDALAVEFEFLLNGGCEVDFEGIGFEMPEVEVILGDAVDEVEEPPVPPVSPGAPVSQLGDLWHLGAHRLFCGNALDLDAYQTVCGGRAPAASFSDPPFNVPVNGHVSSTGQHGEFAQASGEMTDAEFTAFLTHYLERSADVCRPGAVLFVCMDWRHIDVLIMSGKSVGLELINLCVWNKTNGGMGSLYRSKHELVAVFRCPGASHTNNVQLGRFGRNRTNVWDYAGANSFSDGRKDTLAMHPTVKPVSLVSDALLDVTDRGDLVLDPFAGSGTTILAAERTHRTTACIELDPKYVDVAIKWFEAETGQSAVLAGTGQSFAAVAERRQSIPCEAA